MIFTFKHILLFVSLGMFIFEFSLFFFIKKNLNEQDHENLETSFNANGILYDREVMVVEQRADGKLELQSGFNRHHVLLTKLGKSLSLIP